jgi:hypothetical protein
MAKSESTVGGLRDEEDEGRDWERVSPRRVSAEDWRRFEGYISAGYPEDARAIPARDVRFNRGL